MVFLNGNRDTNHNIGGPFSHLGVFLSVAALMIFD
jgi:hypothetical protein